MAKLTHACSDRHRADTGCAELLTPEEGTVNPGGGRGEATENARGHLRRKPTAEDSVRG